MAPAPRTATAGTLEKENRRPAGAAAKCKAAAKDVPTTAAPRLRRALTDRGNLGTSGPGDEKKPTSGATPTPARGRAGGGSATAGGPTTPRATSNSRPVSAASRPRAGSGGSGGAATPRTRRGPAPDPWAEVRAATEKADKLEAELAALSAEFEAAEAEALEAEAKESEAEQQLTSKSAEMLAEYAAAHERFRTLEEELRTARERLDSCRKENLELSRRNIELDRETRVCKEQIEEAQTLLDKVTSSQGSLDAEIVERLAACERLREAAEGQCERLEGDLRRFTTMKARLLELVDSAGQERQREVQLLVAEADAMAEKTRLTLEACMKVAQEGIVPPEALPEAAEGEQQKEEAPEKAEGSDGNKKEEEARELKPDVQRPGQLPSLETEGVATDGEAGAGRTSRRRSI